MVQIIKKNINEVFKIEVTEFLLWLRGNETNWYSWGCGFELWPRSVGWGSGIAMSCGGGHRSSLDPALLWLWHRPAAVVPIQLLAWELPYAAGAASKSKKIKNKIKLKSHLNQNKIYEHLFLCLATWTSLCILLFLLAKKKKERKKSANNNVLLILGTVFPLFFFIFFLSFWVF